MNAYDDAWKNREFIIRSNPLKYGFLRLVPASIIQEKVLPKVPVKKMLRLEDNGAINIYSPLTGACVDMSFGILPLTSEQMMRLDPQDKLRLYVDALTEYGVSGFGLGAYTKIIGGQGGKQIAEYAAEKGKWVTNGNRGTSYFGVKALLEAAKRTGYCPAELEVSIIGATGSTGSAAAQIIAPDVGSVLLYGRDLERLKMIQKKILERNPGKQCRVTTNLQEACKSRLIITVTGAETALKVEPFWFSGGAIIIDLARPRDISQSIAHQRHDLLVIEGGVLTIPGDSYTCNTSYGFPHGLTYACMAEPKLIGMIHCKEGASAAEELCGVGKDFEVEDTLKIGRLMESHGFELTAFRRFGEVIPEEAMDRHKEVVRKNWRG
jgi:predicted amino acid dehydrogenase